MTTLFFRQNQAILFSCTLFLGAFGIVGDSNASGCGSVTGGANAAISANCSDLVLNGAGSVVINSGVTVDAVGAPIYAIDVTGSSATLTNNGIISSYGEGIVVDSARTLQTFNNNGTFSGGVVWAVDIYGTVNTINNAVGADITVSGYTASAPIFTNPGSRLDTLNNYGTLQSLGGPFYTGVIWSQGGSIGAINNFSTGIIDGGSGIGIFNDITSSTISSINNSSGGAITGLDGIGNASGSSIGSITNAGSITGTNSAINNRGTITSITNNTGGTISGTNYAIDNYGTIDTIINNLGATISSSSQPIVVERTGSINTINNYGTIAGGWEGIYSEGSIGTINNFGNITYSPSGEAGIGNNGTITTLNNGQSGGVGLKLYGNLPTYYNVIINSASSYGKLLGATLAGSTTFGISSSSVRLTTTRYAGVLSGLTSERLNNTTGTYLGANWSLVNSADTTWDLLFSSLPIYGPSTADTQQSLVNTASALQGTYTLQNSVLANSFAYDCNEFGANNVCVSAGGRNTAVSAANGLNNTSALLIAAYRPHPNYRIGAYADQNLSVNNAGSTVNLGNNTPLIGLFGVWNQRLNGTGAEVKVSAAYGQKNTTVTRQVVGTSEAGSGSSQLNSQGAQVTAKYGFGISDNVIVSPYIGIRYTQNNMGGYTEGASSTVTAPLTYSALNTNATTALAGVGTSYKVVPAVITFASVGVETDTNTANGSYYGTNSNIAGLTPVNFNSNPVKTRPTATLGAYYNIEKNQRLGITGIYRQEPYQAVSTTTVMVTYTVGL